MNELHSAWPSRFSHARLTILEQVRRVIWSDRRRSDVIDDDIDHEVHPPPVKLVRQVQEILRGPKVVIELREVLDPVSVVGISVRRRARDVLIDGAVQKVAKVGELACRLFRQRRHRLATKPAATKRATHLIQTAVKPMF